MEKYIGHLLVDGCDAPIRILSIDVYFTVIEHLLA